MKNLFPKILLLLMGVFLPSGVFASVVINEIAWMGSPPESGETAQQAANDEWIELYNPDNTPLDLTGWVLKAKDGNPTIELTGTIGAEGYFLLSRSNATVNEVTADQVYPYKGNALMNEGEYLQLLDAQGTVRDEINASDGWPAGDNTTKQTMERKNPSDSGSNPRSWQTSKNHGGTPKTKNGSGAIIIESTSSESPEESADTAPAQQEKQQIQSQGEQTETPPPTQNTETTKTTQTAYPSGITLNELLPSPAGPDEDLEWVEIFNQNEFSVELSGWQIKDTAGSVKTYAFPKGTTIGPKAYLVISRPTSGITLNNDADGLILLNPVGQTVDEVRYEKAPTDQSYNSLDRDWQWSNILTPGSANIIPESKTSQALTEQKREKSLGERDQLAAAAESIPSEAKRPMSRSFYPFLIAAALAIFLGTAVLFSKRKLIQE